MACQLWRQKRLNRGNVIADYLSSLGIAVDIMKAREYAGSGNLGRAHFAKYLVDNGMVHNRTEAFDLYLDTEEFRRATERKMSNSEEAISIIHDAGGRAVLAHPGIYQMNSTTLEKMVCRLAETVIDGIECIYSKHNKS